MMLTSFCGVRFLRYTLRVMVTPSFWRALDGISFVGRIHTYSVRVRLDVFHIIWSGRTLGPSLDYCQFIVTFDLSTLPNCLRTYDFPSMI